MNAAVDRESGLTCEDATLQTGRTNASAGARWDYFLGGRLKIAQSEDRRLRGGLDAVCLAAAISDDFCGTAVDLGAGTGTAGLCLATRCPCARIILAENNADACSLARQTLAASHNVDLSRRVRLCQTDALAPHNAGLTSKSADCVIVNPPFRRLGETRRSPVPGRAAAHSLGAAGLTPWIGAAADILRPQGTLAMIFPASGINDALNALASQFGGILVLGLHPHASAPASRIVIRAVRGSRAALQLLPAMVIHGDGPGRFTAQMRDVVHDGGTLMPAHNARASINGRAAHHG